MARFLFPRWANLMPAAIFFGVLGPFATAVAGGLWYYGTDKFLSVGYTPNQPVDYSHKLHAGDLGMDCRYCHNTVEEGAHAAVPPVATCMNCHSKVKQDSTKLLPLREAWASGKPLPWVRIHNLPDYVYFDHSAHLSAGVGCTSCHGQVDQMVKVSQVEPLTMGWCLECHRDPAPHLRPQGEITNMAWKLREDATEAITDTGRVVSPPLHCSGCHR